LGWQHSKSDKRFAFLLNLNLGVWGFAAIQVNHDTSPRS
jgi:hypothetical protein